MLRIRCAFAHATGADVRDQCEAAAEGAGLDPRSPGGRRSVGADLRRQIERGKRNPTLEVVERFAKVLQN